MMEVGAMLENTEILPTRDPFLQLPKRKKYVHFAGPRRFTFFDILQSFCAVCKVFLCRVLAGIGQG